MKPMQFVVECVHKCLFDNAKVYTVRGYDMKDTYVEVKGIGKCERIQGFQVFCKEDLESKPKYLKFSGFESVDEWWNAIMRFC